MKTIIAIAILVLVGFVSCEYVDMTHELHATMLHWPGRKFTLTKQQAGKHKTLDWLAYNEFRTPEHMGTHIDSPYHFYDKGARINEIPLSRLHGPAVVIDISERAKINKNAEVLISDIKNWESKHGRIPDGSFVMMNSDWSKYWKTDDQFGGVGSHNDTDMLNFPGFHPDTTRWLIENRPGISAVGVDTMSCDHGSSKVYESHVILLTDNKMCMENVANIGDIPESGAEIFALPLKIRDGSGAPARVYAVWNEHVPHSRASYAQHLNSALLFSCILKCFYNI